jgi:hypothetical protein
LFRSPGDEKSNLEYQFSSKIHKRTALVIVDVQNDFITGSLNNSRAPAILPKVYQLLDDHEWPFIVASQGKVNAISK